MKVNDVLIKIDTDLSKLKIINNNIRNKIRYLSSLAQTEIEPKISSEIIDEILEKGINFGICPGGIKLFIFLAGGYDGIFIFGSENTYEIIQIVIKTLNDKNKDKMNINFFPIEGTEEGVLIY
jgi:phosphomevalonate kinase